MTKKPRRVAVVPHTHWDREWYSPFQTFRMRLVETVDALLDLMEQDPSFRHFLLDGQMAVIDDYLEIRPENRDRLAALTISGRINVGPWYILMDEFLVSGETIIRNLQYGMKKGNEFGGALEVGYLPDMFGHIGQMPQILRQVGFEHAVVWRGVPSAIDRSAFNWAAPDGSTVTAEYLVAGYGNGAALPGDAKALLRRLDSLIEEFEPFTGSDEPLLLMNGSDHFRAQDGLGRSVAEANLLQDEVSLRIESLATFLATAHRTDLPTWSGELRSGARSNLLMGVGSNRVDVKQAAARAERELEQWAEPLSALFLPPDEWPERFLHLAWLEVIRNSAHDSICACSHDAVVDAVLHRYAEAHHIATGLTARALRSLSRSMAGAGHFVVNPSANGRSGVVELVVPADGPPSDDVQVLSEQTGLPGTMTLDGETVLSVLGLVQGTQLGPDLYITGLDLNDDGDGIDLTVAIGSEPGDSVPIEELKRELYTRFSVQPRTEVRLKIDQPPARRILARSPEVPGFGWNRFSPAPLGNRVSTDGLRLGNTLVEIEVDPVDGTFTLNGIPGYGRLVDDGDLGDTYNYSPPPGDLVVSSPVSVDVSTLESGPVRGRMEIRSTYTWPDRVDPATKTRSGERDVLVTTTLEVRADEPVVRIHTEFDNAVRDHRLRVHLPLREATRTSRAECAFDIVERGLAAEGRPEEFPTPTFPSRRFVTAGGLTVVHDGLLEYELVDIDDDGAHTLALTLLRATGMLSRLGMSTRPLPAGPMDALRGPQMIGPVAVDYALSTSGDDPYATAQMVLVPLATTSSFGGGDRSHSGTELELSGAQVSSLRRVAGVLEVRVFNPDDEPTVVRITGRHGWLMDLRGQPVDPFEEEFPLRAHGITTCRLDDI